jgi:hypothetical protein
LSVAAQVAPPDYPPLDAKTIAGYDRAWERYQKREPNSGARDLYGFLLTVVAHNWRPEKWAAIVTLVEELHDRDPASPTYGNYRWYWREPKPNDRNALEFSMQCASLAWVAYRDRMPEDARRALADAFALSAEGLVRHKVDVSYTNIFLMRIANSILIGETTGRPDLVAQGRHWFDEWFAYTRANGVHEFSSPTYYGTDLTDLGALANYARTPAVRAQAEAALRLLWTDIAANWFTPYEGIAGAHSRDYGFLTGHGYLDQPLMRAGWLKNTSGESHPAIDDITFWNPPAAVRAAIPAAPRVVTQRFGAQPWERATHYVGQNFSLGSSGAGYGAQDKVLTLTLAGGPKLPLVNFALDYHRDPYGQQQLATADGHSKLTHLLPFIASVQRGPEALLVAAYNPATARNPIGGKAPITYESVNANFVLPAAAELWDAHGPLAAGETVSLSANSPLFLRFQTTAAALAFVVTRDDTGQSASLAVVRDGEKVGAARLTATLAPGAPRERVLAAVWVRAAEDITSDAAFATFRTDFLRAAARTKISSRADALDLTVAGTSAPLHLSVDLAHEKRLAAEGADPSQQSGILVVNGRDLGAGLLATP